MSDPFLGEIRLFAGTYAPNRWAACNGQALNIAGNEALYALIGATYGGDQTSFHLPNLNGRLAVGAGQAASGTTYAVGGTGGTDTVSLSAAMLPAHIHSVRASTKPATDNVPGPGLVCATTVADVRPYNDLSTGSGDALFSPKAIGSTGSGAAHDNTMPCLGLGYIIAIVGIFPDFS